MTATAQTDKESIGKAIGRIASGVYVATVMEDGQPQGVLLTWVAQAGFEPPCLTFAVNKARPILPLLTPGHAVVVNVLAEGNNDIFKRFAAPGKPGQERFADLPLLEGPETSAPVFKDASAYLDCRVLSVAETGGDHAVVVASIVSGAMLSEAKPMVHLRKNGFSY